MYSDHAISKPSGDSRPGIPCWLSMPGRSIGTSWYSLRRRGRARHIRGALNLGRNMTVLRLLPPLLQRSNSARELRRPQIYLARKCLVFQAAVPCNISAVCDRLPLLIR